MAEVRTSEVGATVVPHNIEYLCMVIRLFKNVQLLLKCLSKFQLLAAFPRRGLTRLDSEQDSGAPQPRCEASRRALRWQQRR